MEKQNNQKKYSNIIIVILLVVSLIIVSGFGYYKYKDIKDAEERIAKQHEERKAAEEKVKQNMLKVHKIDKTSLSIYIRKWCSFKIIPIWTYSFIS